MLMNIFLIACIRLIYDRYVKFGIRYFAARKSSPTEQRIRIRTYDTSLYSLSSLVSFTHSLTIPSSRYPIDASRSPGSYTQCSSRLLRGRSGLYQGLRQTIMLLFLLVVASIQLAPSYRVRSFLPTAVSLRRGLHLTATTTEEPLIESSFPAQESQESKSSKEAFFGEDAPRVTWTAAAKGSVSVKDARRTVEEYMALPASQYSVLSAKQIERLSETEFKCTLGTMNFFGTKISPVLYVDVVVYPEDAKAEIIVARAETTGSEIADKISGTFSIRAVNTVFAGVDSKGKKTLNSETTLKIDVLVPPSNIPVKMIQSGGNFLMQQSLNVIVPTFVRILRADFNRWSSGEDDRSAVEGATLG